MRSFEDIQKAKDEAALNEQMLTIEQVFPGYLIGGDLVFEGEIAYIGPVIANVQGNKAVVPTKTRLSDCTWTVPKLNSYRYYIYIDKLSYLHVEVIAPVTINSLYGKYHPITSWRYLNTFYVNSVGRITEVTVSTLQVVGYSGSGTPYAAVSGDTRLVLESDEIKFQSYDGSTWTTDINIQNNIDSLTSDLADALELAGDAYDLADGKIESYFQTTAPSGDLNTGDLWFDTDDGNKQYRWSGSAWVDAQDDAIATALSDAADAQATADGKVVTFYDDEVPTAEATGDLWYCTGDVGIYYEGELYRWSGATWVLTTDNTGKRIQPIMANFPGPITVGFYSLSGTSTYDDPDEGDRRTYIDEDEVGLEEYTAGAWTTVNSIILGGSDGDGNFLPFLGCRGIYNPLGDPPGALLYPHYTSTEDCETTPSNMYLDRTSVQKKHGSYSWASNNVLGGAVINNNTDLFINSFQSDIKKYYVVADGYCYHTSYPASSTRIAKFLHDDTDNSLLEISVYCDAAGAITAQAGENGSLSAISMTETLPLNEWVLVGVELVTESEADPAEDVVLSVTINNNKYSRTFDCSTFAAKGVNNSSLTLSSLHVGSYFDSLSLSISEHPIYDIYLQRRLSSSWWTTGYSAEDAILLPAPGGVGRTMGDHVVDGELTHDAFPWHEIGDSGEPAFENSWVNYSTDYNSAAFRLCDGGNSVELKGMVKSGSLGDYAIFTLPAGYRPLKINVFPVASNGAFGFCDVHSDGRCRAWGGSGASFPLDGIRFSIT